ncbi:MAG: hypothetical protein II629_07225, partial [Ruminococcus sp.]|nr:hypothetical protein [Ruminococcus sp.]
EGKRNVSKIGRSAKGEVRLPSSVTLPPKFALSNGFYLLLTDYAKITNLLRQCAIFSSGEGFA